MIAQMRTTLDLDEDVLQAAKELAEARGFTVARSALADGRRVDSLPLAERAWVGGVRRDGRRVQVNGSLVLTPGDRVDVYCEPADEPALRRIFEGAQS